jgi:hypothetical protein
MEVAWRPASFRELAISALQALRLGVCSAARRYVLYRWIANAA